MIASVASAKAKGATHALLVHMVDSRITNYVALAVDDVAEAYRQQIAQWRKRARNTKTPTLWFEDARGGPDADCITAVTSLELSLSSICGLSDDPNDDLSGECSDSGHVLELKVTRRPGTYLPDGGQVALSCLVSDTPSIDCPGLSNTPP